MKISFQTHDGRFNYNVAALIIQDDKLLICKNELFPSYYLPSCRVDMLETAEAALLANIQKNLEVEAEIVRPVWLVESLKEGFHDLTLYFQVAVEQTDLVNRGDLFRQFDEDGWTDYAWVSVDKLRQVDVYPEFIKEELSRLPEHFTLRTES